MLKKLKEKKIKLRVFFTCAFGIFIFLAVFAALNPRASANTGYEANQISFSLDTQVADSNGNFTNNNYIKLVKNQDVKVKVIFTLIGPPQGLNINSDTSQADYLTYNNVNGYFTAIGVAAIPVSDPTNANSGIATDADLLSMVNLRNVKINANSPQTFDLVIPWSTISSSNLVSNAFGSNTPNFLIGPAVLLNAPKTFWDAVKAGLANTVGLTGLVGEEPTKNIAFFSPQKRMYVSPKVYDNQTDANADTTVPKDVPGYGSVTGSLTAPPAARGPLLSLLNNIIDVIVGFIREFIFVVFYYLVAPLIQATLSIRTYSDTFAAVIYPGWIVVRNLCNILFIVALIAIGLGTLFRVESYQYKHLLVQLIIAALLVNFSLVIAQAVLGVADTLQAQFLPHNLEVIRALAENLMVGNLNLINNLQIGVIGGSLAGGTFADTVKPLFFLALALGSFLVFLAIGAYLLIRIVMLWVLLMISPIAYAAGILPTTTQYRTEWWKTFLKYAFFTPIMAFFLNMTAIIAGNSTDNPVFKRVLQDPSVIGSSDSFVSFVISVGSNILLLVFLIVALKVAEQAGIYGASTISNWAKKGMFAPFTLSAKGLKLAGKGVKTLGSAALRGYSGFMGTKAFEAVQEEVKAKQAVTALKGKISDRQKALAQLRADPNADPEDIEKLEKEIEDLSHGMHVAESAEQQAGRKKMLAGLAQFLNPIAVKKGWEARKRMLEERAYQPAEGAVHDILNRYMPTEWGIWHKDRQSNLGRITDYAFVNKLGVIREEAKHLENLSINRNFAVYAMDNATRSGNWEEKIGQALLTAKQNQQDDVGNLSDEEHDFAYTCYNDLMNLKNKVWAGMPKAAREVMAVQLLEEQEASGRGRSMFFNEDRNSTVDDLAYMQDPKKFQETMVKVATDLRQTKDAESIEIADKIDGLVRNNKGISDIVDADYNPLKGMEDVHESIVSSDISRILFAKQTRGNIRKWLAGMNPAEVRRQTLDGWDDYTTLGLMKLAKAPKALFQIYLRRMHEGEVRTAVYGGAMVDPETKDIRMPRSPEQLRMAGIPENSAKFKHEVRQYKQYKRVVRVRPELAASVSTFFTHPRLAERVLDEVDAGNWALNPDDPAAGLLQVNKNPDGSFASFGGKVDLDAVARGAMGGAGRR